MKPLPFLLALWLAACGPGCRSRPAGLYQGYLEGEFVYVAAPLAGTLTNLAVRRGDQVKNAQPLFALEAEAEASTVREASNRLAQARARLNNLRKGRRPSEIATLQGQLERAQAALQLSKAEWNRVRQLGQSGAAAPNEVDQAKSRFAADTAQVESIQAELETAQLGGRVDEVHAAEAEERALAAALARTEWGLAQKCQVSPADARVQDTLFRVGEFVPAAQPVVTLLPPENIKVRFFVPQAELARLHYGQNVSVSIDGRAEPLTARVNYVSSQAEFTPPVIYSKENRAKMVFMVEAIFAPADAPALRPGQPVDVRLTPGMR